MAKKSLARDAARAVIEDGVIIIRVPVKNLPAIIEGSWATGNLEPRMKITDADAFAKDLARELNDESEDGSTRIHKMFDAAIDEAINQGAEGIKVHRIQNA
jgi:hypothetical protein